MNKIRIRLTALLVTFAVLQSACANYASRSDAVEELYNPVPAVATEVDACTAQLGSGFATQAKLLDSSDIRVVNWNIQKGRDPQWKKDLDTIDTHADLLILQEAPISTNTSQNVSSGRYHAFAPGYRSRRALTGVMTVSADKPLTQCNLTTVEPWLRTPKATMITEYGLSDSAHTLLVVNIHAVNFTFGIAAFRNQINLAQTVIRQHPGPVLFSGDFNTWSNRRAAVLRDAVDNLDLAPLDYENDHRKRAFGNPLDHIYVRGLEVQSATTEQLQSSDHSPMSVRVRL